MKILPDIHLGKKNDLQNDRKKVDRFIEDEPLQLDLGLKESPLNKLFAARQKLEKIEDRLKISQYWKNPVLWIIILFPFTIALIFSKFYFEIQSSLPDQIPLVAFHTNISDVFLPKLLLLIIPIVIFAFSIVVVGLFRISYRKMEKYAFMVMLLYSTLTIISYYSIFQVVKLYV